ncbi:MAG: hypothetical protein LBB82_03020 [Treponema sp.]|jgi:hypothetical protein|nr:hypothetical protein [Treponema sp.]
MGLVLSGEELRILFPLLKGIEAQMKSAERALLLKVEKALYEQLSIREIENLRSAGGLV